ncbi:hypothetical protein VKT23_017003 [Stygiomarasmius scandens]|uniref:Nephrocystin 3-like N-terminal domain-containing protein n=1 Tax=Marasmiellus scandens TaxID=2682957 RepID=A0ABR1ITQ3_9AGAR
MKNNKRTRSYSPDALDSNLQVSATPGDTRGTLTHGTKRMRTEDLTGQQYSSDMSNMTSSTNTAITPGINMHMFQHASNSSIQNSTLNVAGRDQYNNILYKDEEDALLKEKLNPIQNPAKKLVYCLDGTRIQLLQDLKDWATNAESSLAWVFGIAGTGKSAVAVSFAAQIRATASDQIALALTFHCVRTEETSNISSLVPTQI